MSEKYSKKSVGETDFLKKNEKVRKIKENEALKEKDRPTFFEKGLKKMDILVK